MKKQYFCNPLNMDYRYQFIQDMRSGEDKISREAADPSMILFQGKYYIFASMTLSVWVSEDMVHWESHRLPDSLPLYDYAPDVRVVGDYVYFSASRRGTICDFYRTKDIRTGRLSGSREPSISGIRTCFLMMTESSIFTGDAIT